MARVAVELSERADDARARDALDFALAALAFEHEATLRLRGEGWRRLEVAEGTASPWRAAAIHGLPILVDRWPPEDVALAAPVRLAGREAEVGPDALCVGF